MKIRTYEDIKKLFIDFDYDLELESEINECIKNEFDLLATIDHIYNKHYEDCDYYELEDINIIVIEENTLYIVAISYF